MLGEIPISFNTFFSHNSILKFLVFHSHRELTMMYGPQFCSSIDEYKLVEMLVNSVYAVKSKEKSTNYLQCLDAETLRLVIEFAFPGLGPLVPSFIQKRNLRAYIEKGFSKTGKENSSFMICLRKRPLCHFEENQGYRKILS